MEITFANLGKSLGKDLIKSASKCQVRECDETEPGYFVAYVDEGNDTFDVTVRVNGKQQFVDNSCDCKSTRKICQHKAALMLHIAGRTETKTKGLKKAKVKEVDTILDAADPAAVISWLKKQFSVDKELEISFLNAFRIDNAHPEPETIRKASMDAQKAVIGRIQKVDARLTLKLLTLWATIHDPVRKYYAEHPTDNNAFQCYMEVTDVLVGFRQRYYINSSKFNAALENHLQLPATVLAGIQHETTLNTAVGFISQISFVPIEACRLVAENFISNLFQFNHEQKRHFTQILLKETAKQTKYDKQHFSRLISLLLRLSVELDLFDDHQHVFEPIGYAPHDDLLLSVLVEKQYYDRAIALLQPYVTLNMYPAQQLRALETLKSIYTITGNEQGLTEILMALVPLNYNFEDYQLLLQRLDPAEAKRVTAPLLHKAISSMHVRRDFFDFIFNVYAVEKEYDKMIRYLPKALSYEAIIPWFETLAVFDREATFKAMLTLSDQHFNQAARKPVARLVELTMDLYPIDYLQGELKKLLSRYHILAVNSYIRSLAERFEF